MLQGWGISGHGVRLLLPRGWAVLSFPEREKLEGVFLAAATQAGGELMRDWGPSRDGQQGGFAAPHLWHILAPGLAVFCSKNKVSPRAVAHPSRAVSNCHHTPSWQQPCW